MDRIHRPSAFLYFCFIAAGFLSLVAADSGFHRQACYETVTEMIGNDSSITMNPSIFISESDPTNPILTLDGCRQLCGSGTGWYPDSGPRLVSWLLPIVLLVSNMQFAPIGGQKFLLILHLLGDPIDSTWSLLMKADHWSRCFAHAQNLLREKIAIKSLAVILAATDEDSDAFDHALNLDAPRHKSLIIETALTLSENRRNEILRTLLAVALYVFSVVSAFVPTIGESSSPSGGRIGTAMLLSWLLSVVLLSNAIGEFGSTQNCRRIVAEFVKRLGQQPDPDSCPLRNSMLNLGLIGVQMKTQTSHEVSVAWSGAIYCYSPNKQLFHGSGWKLAVISVLPVAIAFGTAFAVLDTGPSYFSCRHILVVTVFGLWLISVILTLSMSWGSLTTGKYLWYIILIKDTIFAITNLTLIVASCCGLGNTCYCWSGALVHGERGVSAPLNPAQVFDRNNNIIYPAMVATCLSLQVCVFGAMLWIRWSGFRALWWSENEKREASNFRRSTKFSSIATQIYPVQLQCPRDSRNGNMENTPKYSTTQDRQSPLTSRLCFP